MDPAEPLPTFDVLALSTEVRRAVDELGYMNPTPVQRAVYEPAIRGGDLVVQARTGTGKTAAFGLPVVDKLVKRDVAAAQVLVLSPTRELALQISRELTALGKYRNVKPAAVYGGAPMQRQIDEIQAGAQVVVGTPGRVLDHLRRGTLDPASIRAVVLDESDEMLSMGFLPQITDILEMMPTGHQTLLFSATVPPDVRRIAETRLKDPEFITLSGDHIGALEIDHFVYLCPRDKTGTLARIIEIENPESAIIFCNTREQTKRVAAALQQQGFAADWLNADLAQSDREKVMAATRESRLRFLVATDVAARGIDISHLTHVINADFPESTENYVHRTGRTGRAGRTGTAISLITPQDVGNLYMLKLTYKIFPIERQLPTARELKTREETDLVNLFAEAFGARRAHPDDLGLARRLLTHEQSENIIAGLIRDHLGARPEVQREAESARRRKQPRAAPLDAKPQEPSAPRADEVKEPPPKRSATPEREDRSRPRRDENRRDRDEGRRDRSRGPGEAHAEEREARAVERPRRRPIRERDFEARRPPRPEDAGERTNSNEAATREETPPPSEPSSLESISAADLLASPSSEDVVRLFVNVGRKDGARREDFAEVLEEQGFEEHDIAFVKVRERHTFIGVPSDLERRAIQALDGTEISGRTAMAERARERARD